MTEAMMEPTPSQVIGSLGTVHKLPYRMAAYFLYLVDGRPSECVGYASARDTSTSLLDWTNWLRAVARLACACRRSSIFFSPAL